MEECSLVHWIYCVYSLFSYFFKRTSSIVASDNCWLFAEG